MRGKIIVFLFLEDIWQENSQKDSMPARHGGSAGLATSDTEDLWMADCARSAGRIQDISSIIRST
jgi:hypothetical protein